MRTGECQIHSEHESCWILLKMTHLARMVWVIVVVCASWRVLECDAAAQDTFVVTPDAQQEARGFSLLFILPPGVPTPLGHAFPGVQSTPPGGGDGKTSDSLLSETVENVKLFSDNVKVELDENNDHESEVDPHLNSDELELTNKSLERGNIRHLARTSNREDGIRQFFSSNSNRFNNNGNQFGGSVGSMQNNRIIGSNPGAAISMVENFVEDMTTKPVGERPGYIMINSPNPAIIQQLVTALTQRYGSGSVIQEPGAIQNLVSNPPGNSRIQAISSSSGNPGFPVKASGYHSDSAPVFPYESYWSKSEGAPKDSGDSEADYIRQRLASVAHITVSTGKLINDTMVNNTPINDILDPEVMIGDITNSNTHSTISVNLNTIASTVTSLIPEAYHFTTVIPAEVETEKDDPLQNALDDLFGNDSDIPYNIIRNTAPNTEQMNKGHLPETDFYSLNNSTTLITKYNTDNFHHTVATSTTFDNLLPEYQDSWNKMNDLKVPPISPPSENNIKKPSGIYINNVFHPDPLPDNTHKEPDNNLAELSENEQQSTYSDNLAELSENKQQTYSNNLPELDENKQQNYFSNLAELSENKQQTYSNNLAKLDENKQQIHSNNLAELSENKQQTYSPWDGIQSITTLSTDPTIRHTNIQISTTTISPTIYTPTTDSMNDKTTSVPHLDNTLSYDIPEVNNSPSYDSQSGDLLKDSVKDYEWENEVSTTGYEDYYEEIDGELVLSPSKFMRRGGPQMMDPSLDSVYEDYHQRDDSEPMKTNEHHSGQDDSEINLETTHDSNSGRVNEILNFREEQDTQHFEHLNSDKVIPMKDEQKMDYVYFPEGFGAHNLESFKPHSLHPFSIPQEHRINQPYHANPITNPINPHMQKGLWEKKEELSKLELLQEMDRIPVVYEEHKEENVIVSVPSLLKSIPPDILNHLFHMRVKDLETLGLLKHMTSLALGDDNDFIPVSRDHLKLLSGNQGLRQLSYHENSSTSGSSNDIPVLSNGGLDVPVRSNGDVPVGPNGSLDVPVHSNGGLDVPVHSNGGFDVPVHSNGSLDIPVRSNFSHEHYRQNIPGQRFPPNFFPARPTNPPDHHTGSHHHHHPEADHSSHLTPEQQDIISRLPAGMQPVVSAIVQAVHVPPVPPSTTPLPQYNYPPYPYLPYPYYPPPPLGYPHTPVSAPQANHGGDASHLHHTTHGLHGNPGVHGHGALGNHGAHGDHSTHNHGSHSSHHSTHSDHTVNHAHHDHSNQNLYDSNNIHGHNHHLHDHSDDNSIVATTQPPRPNQTPETSTRQPGTTSRRPILPNRPSPSTIRPPAGSTLRPAVVTSALSTLNPSIGASRLGEFDASEVEDIVETGIRDNDNRQGSVNRIGPSQPDRNQGLLNLRQDAAQMGHGRPSGDSIVNYRPPQQSQMHMGQPVINVVLPETPIASQASPAREEEEVGSLIDLTDAQDDAQTENNTPQVHMDREEASSLLQSLFSSPTLLLLGIIFATSAAYMAIAMEEQSAQQQFQQAQLAAAFGGQPFFPQGRRKLRRRRSDKKFDASILEWYPRLPNLVKR